MGDFDIKERFRLGILFNFSPKWMGGLVYIINLIETLSFLVDKNKPEIILFYKPDLRTHIEQINYPYLKFVEWQFPSVYKGYLKSWFTRRNVFIDEILKNYDLDGLYPLQDYPVKTKTNTRLVSWYADLQHKYYPEFFTRRKIIERNCRIRFMLKNTKDLVVSSQSVADDFERFFGLRHGMKMHVFHFVSVIDDFSGFDIDNVREKYKLPQKYFMISNQFHQHKNHILLLKALVKLREQRSDIHLAMTGRFPDDSHSPYLQELHSIIDKHKLQSQISLLGVIPRNEQLLLMKHSQAVLQPSLFEGWSTVIEDAMSLQVPVIASNIPVNIEQLGSKGVYFDPHNEKQLASILHNFSERNPLNVYYDDYSTRIKEAARIFLQIFR